MSDLITLIKKRLWQQFKGINNCFINEVGYVDSPAHNLIPGIYMEMFEKDLKDGSGNELRKKFRAVHSSSALTVNTFAKWKKTPHNLMICGVKGFDEITFEKKCKTGLGGTPPHLDLLLKNNPTATGIESKFLEFLKPKKPAFCESYSRKRLPQIEDQWWNLLQDARKGEPQYLDIAQLIKHYLGLRKQYGGQQRVILLYLFWEPENAKDIKEFKIHREEIMRFAAQVEGGSIKFIAKSYPELWKEWDNQGDLAEHLRHLRKRYCLAV